MPSFTVQKSSGKGAEGREFQHEHAGCRGTGWNGWCREPGGQQEYKRKEMIVEKEKKKEEEEEEKKKKK